MTIDRPRAVPTTVSATADLKPDATVAPGKQVRKGGPWRAAWTRYLKHRGAVVAGAMLLLLVLFAIVVPIVSPYDPNRVDLRSANIPPSPEHPFGTDRVGRDMLTRTAVGIRISLAIGFGATIAILLIGVAYGSTAGFVGGRLDNIMMRFLDALYGLPYIPFAILTLVIVGTANFWTMVIALSIASWFTTARIVRGQIITLKQNDYVRAAKVVGARWHWLLRRHLLPNTLGILIIAIFLELPGVILGEAFLSFLGLGIRPPEASLGSLARDGFASFRVYPWQIVIPSVTIALIVLSAHFIADGLRDALDPRTKATY